MVIESSDRDWDRDAARVHYDTDELFQLFLDKMAGRERSPKDHKTTVESVQSEFRVPRNSAIRMLRKFAAVGCGEFKAGRRGHESRLVWSISPLQVARETRGATQPEIVSEENAPNGVEFIEQTFQLRAGVTAVVKVPNDTTQIEAEKLANVVKSVWWCKE
jgi:hypothetical protein